MATKKCPVCGVPVKVENLERHLRNQHPRDRVEAKEVLTAEERRTAEKSKAAARPALTSAGKRNIAILAIVVAAVLIAAIYLGLGRGGTNPGQIAPDFTLTSTTGTPVKLSSLRGSPVLLEFMDVDCHYCEQEAGGVLTYVHQAYAPRGVYFLSVDMNFLAPDDTPDRIATFEDKYNVHWTYALDQNQQVSNLYGVTGTPTTFILDRNGVVVQAFHGIAPNGYSSYSDALNVTLRA